MTEGFWQKIKKNHPLLMVLCCIVPIILVFGFFILFKGGGNWAWLIVLLCPILHFWMMRVHKESEVYKCSECGFLYKEKEWAEKCEAWCKKYKSCNLEITKHAIKIKK